MNQPEETSMNRSDPTKDLCEEIGMFGRVKIRCNFQPRFDLVPMTVVEMFGGQIPANCRGRLPDKATYVCDVCTACGKKVLR